MAFFIKYLNLDEVKLRLIVFKISLSFHIYKKCFHEDGFDAVISCYEDQTTSQLYLHYILLFDYIITAE